MLTATFTDPQGVTHTDAVVYVRTATYNTNQYASYTLSSADFTTENTEEPVAYESVNCSFYYWTNANARSEGKTPYIMANPNENDMDFSFVPDDTYTGTLKDKCEQYFTNVVLPLLTA